MERPITTPDSLLEELTRQGSERPHVSRWYSGSDGPLRATGVLAAGKEGRAMLHSIVSDAVRVVYRGGLDRWAACADIELVYLAEDLRDAISLFDNDAVRIISEELHWQDLWKVRFEAAPRIETHARALIQAAAYRAGLNVATDLRTIALDYTEAKP